MEFRKNNVILRITERCLVSDENEKECFGLRHYLYLSDTSDTDESIVDFIKNFDTDNIIANSSNDEFDGECLGSEIIKIEVLSEEESKDWY